MSEKTYRIKLADKAAFLNRLKKQNISICKDCMKSDTLEEPHHFEVKFNDPEEIKKVNIILKQSTKIDDLKEVLKKIVKEELDKRG